MLSASSSGEAAESLWGFELQQGGRADPAHPPRMERPLLLRGGAERGPWGSRALLSYRGFANLPANSKQPPEPCTPPEPLLHSTALPSTRGRHWYGAAPAGRLGAASLVAQAVPVMGRGSPFPKGLSLLTPGCTPLERWVLSHTNRADVAPGSTAGNLQSLCVRRRNGPQPS